MNRETIPIAYEIEQTDAGWVVWRRLLQRPGWTGDERATPGSPYPSRREAEEEVDAMRRADRAAATRLGLEVEHR